MRYILNESKRDELAVPYYKIMLEHDYQGSLSQFISYMLRKLESEGGFSNLSLGSHFYLAGVIRYYFNGDLTTNKDLSVFKGEGATDEWDVNTCERLNALIVILRNIHIDSVGTKLEQPEDFGTLPINKLLRKYGAKINKELGIEGPKKEVVDTFNVDRDAKVSGNYTFEIMYNYPMCTKYKTATEPGAWCITKNIMHLEHYTNTTHGHFVIFKQDGWESINRKNGKDESKWVTDDYNRKDVPRPHDPYANSLIAFVQSNSSYMPANYDGAPLITSRWNHGWDDTGGPWSLEADRAYSFDEFKQITGVDDAQLQRIYEIWKHDKALYKEESEEQGKTAAEKRGIKNSSLRNLKYIQILINGGQNPENLVSVEKVLNGNGKATKSLLSCSYTPTDMHGNPTDDPIRFLMDKGKIIFETMGTSVNDFKGYYLGGEENDNDYRNDGFKMYKNCVICVFKDYYMIYNIRFHSLLNIDGIMKFKTIPHRRWRNKENTVYYEVKRAHETTALVDINTNMPLKLPNGRYWFETIRTSDHNNYRGREVEAYVLTNNSCICEIVYDSAAGEKYFFNPITKRFINTPKYNGEPYSSSAWDTATPPTVPYVDTSISSPDVYGIYFSTAENRYGNHTDTEIYKADGTLININGKTLFNNPRICKNILMIQTSEDTYYYSSRRTPNYLGFDIDTRKTLAANGVPLILRPSYSYGMNGDTFRSMVVLSPQDSEENLYVFYDTEKHAFIKNPYGYPSDIIFKEKDYVELEDGNYYYVTYKSNEPVPAPTYSWDGRDWRAYHQAENEYYKQYFYIFNPRGDNEYVPNQGTDEDESNQQQSVVPMTKQDIQEMVMEAIRRIIKNI